MAGGGGGGSGGGSPPALESLDRARIVGDTFLGDVYWDTDFGAVFGKDSGQPNQDYLHVYSDKADHVQVFDSTKDGSGVVRPMSWRMGGVEKMSLDAAGNVSIQGKLTVVGAIDPPSVSLSGGTALFYDSADGSTAPVSAAGHGRLRYDSGAEQWQQSAEGGAYVPLGGGPGSDTTAWHMGGDPIGATQKLGSLTTENVSLVWNDIEVCHLGWENEEGKDYYYLKFNRNTDEGQYVQCIQEQSQGTHAYAAIEFTNLDGTPAIFADHDVGVAGHGWVDTGIGIEADDLFVTSNKKLLLEGTAVKLWHRVDDTTGYEVCRVDDGQLAGGIPGGAMTFARNMDSAVVIYAKNTNEDAIIEFDAVANGAAGSFGATGSLKTYYGIPGGSAYALGAIGHMAVATNGAAQDVIVITNQIEAMRAWGSNQGITVGPATGGSQGAGTINVSGGLYKNASAYTNPDYVFEHWATGDIRKFAKNSGAARYNGRMSLPTLEAHCREHFRLPGITGKPMDLFDRQDFVLEKIEEIFTHLFDVQRELSSLAKAA